MLIIGVVNGFQMTITMSIKVTFIIVRARSSVIENKGDEDMDYRIVQKEAFKVIGKVLKVSTKEGEELR